MCSGEGLASFRKYLLISVSITDYGRLWPPLTIFQLENLDSFCRYRRIYFFCLDLLQSRRRIFIFQLFRWAFCLQHVQLDLLHHLSSDDTIKKVSFIVLRRLTWNDDLALARRKIFHLTGRGQEEVTGRWGTVDWAIIGKIAYNSRGVKDVLLWYYY